MLNTTVQQVSQATSFKLLIVISICGKVSQMEHLHETTPVKQFKSFEADINKKQAALITTVIVISISTL